MTEELPAEVAERPVPGHEAAIADLVKRTRPDSDGYKLLRMFADMQLVPLRYATRRLGRESHNDLSLHVLGPLSRTFNAIESERGINAGWLYIWLPEHVAWAVSYITRNALRKALGMGLRD